LHQRIDAFRALHAPGSILLLPNAWDAGSAALLKAAGAQAIATTSAGLSWSCGFADDATLPRAALFGAVRAIVRVAGDTPVSVDLEDGYSGDPERVAALVADLRALGIAGINIEDRGADPELLAAKITAIKRTLLAAGDEVFVNARTDVYLFGALPEAEWLPVTIARVRRYAQAGADGIFVPGLTGEADVREIAGATALPLNLMADADLPSIDRLRELGVRRLSSGASIASSAYGAAQRAAASFLRDGATEQPQAQPPVGYAEMNALFERAPVDFRDGRGFPRRGRLALDDFLWLARVSDKARAAAAGTIDDYVYPCPIDHGMLERWGISPGEFDAAIYRYRSDDALLAWVSSRVSHQARDAANAWLLETKMENLERQDKEECAPA
jgi:2-methylisocitrate lyase-like PEP mutase family enzyme